MKLGAVIIENRFNVDAVIENHKKFLPEEFGIMHLMPKSIRTEHDYNVMMTSLDFWKNLPYDKVLIFQHDSKLLRTGIEEFYDYDFIGAPLFHFPMPCMNGGLSFRSKDAMVALLNHYKWNPSRGNEDIFFCQQMAFSSYRKFSLPSKEIAQKFSVETIFGLGSLGVHAIEKWHPKDKCDLILNQYK